MSLVQVTGKCPYCEVRKHQISTEEHALQVISDAIERHVAEQHSERVSPPVSTTGGAP